MGVKKPFMRFSKDLQSRIHLWCFLYLEKSNFNVSFSPLFLGDAHAYSSEDLLGIGRVQFGRYVSKTDWLKCGFSHPQEFGPPMYSLLFVLEFLYLNLYLYMYLYLYSAFERHISQNGESEVQPSLQQNTDVCSSYFSETISLRENKHFKCNSNSANPD